MNHTYKTLYNTALGAWVAVPEIARNRGKAPRSYRYASGAHAFTFARTALASALLLVGGQAWAAIPEGTAAKATDIATRKFPGAMAARQSVPMPKPLRGMTWPLATVRVPKVAAGPVAAETESG